MLLVAVGCAGWAFAAHGGRWSVRLDILTHFIPVIMAAAVVTVIYAFFTEPPFAKWALIGFGGTGVVLAGLLIAPEYLAPRARAEATTNVPGQIKLIQFNAWRGNKDHETTVRWLLAQNADIIVMEESDVIGPLLMRRSNYHTNCSGCSVMIFSKTPPLNLDVPVVDRRGVRPPIARATYRDAHGEFTVVGTHYVWPVYGGWQQEQGRVIARLLRNLPKERLILTGDFNSTPWSFSRRREDVMFGLERRTHGLFSWPARDFPPGIAKPPFPILPIDHVYAGPGWRTVKVERGPRLGSDHYSVVITLAPSA